MRTSIAAIHRMRAESVRIPMITAYDYTSARIVDRTSIPMILVGDSLGMVVQGRDSTLPVTVDDIVYHTRAVMRGCARPLVVADLPFLSYATPEDALRNAGRLMAEGGAQSVKLEGGAVMAPTIRRLVEAGASSARPPARTPPAPGRAPRAPRPPSPTRPPPPPPPATTRRRRPRRPGPAAHHPPARHHPPCRTSAPTSPAPTDND